MRDLNLYRERFFCDDENSIPSTQNTLQLRIDPYRTQKQNNDKNKKTLINRLSEGILRGKKVEEKIIHIFKHFPFFIGVYLDE